MLLIVLYARKRKEHWSYRKATGRDSLYRGLFGLGEGLDEVRADEDATDDALEFDSVSRG